MNADEYVKDNESLLASADVDQTTPTPPLTGTGKLICTDSRLVFDTAKSITDIRVDSISEIDYSPPSYLNRATVAGLLGIIFSGILWLLLAVILPNEQAIALIVFLLGTISILAGLLTAKATLVIKTNSSKYRFRGSETELSKLPHAIRGADRS
ncbi:hypothetical protein ACNO8S_12190 [Haloarcula sp. KBTZ06]|uniref:hypothetical protein n=1 Tax=Haloarcula sp. KBTZ06 TaxID=3402682 RepID=UPI003B429D88